MIKSNYSSKDIVNIYDASGNIVYNNRYKKYIDISHLKAGLYFITFGNERKKIVKK
jgi:hypothetical protein